MAARRVCLDTSAAIYFLSEPAGSPRRRAVEPYVRAAEEGTLALIVSAVVVTELLVRPIRDRLRSAEIAARRLLQLCEVVDVTYAVAAQAAVLRAAYSLRTPDALICATAVVDNCDLVLGNDRRWRAVQEITFVAVDDLP